MKNFMLLLGILMLTPIAFAGHVDNLRLNTFLAEAFPGEGESREFSGLNAEEGDCKVRFRIGHYLHLTGPDQTASAALYEVKVKKINNLKHINFSKKRVSGPNWFGDRVRTYETEVDILKSNGGYLFVVTEREGLFRKFISRDSCFITL